jgi:hypothetical protein
VKPVLQASLNCTPLSWLYVRTNGLAAMERPSASSTPEQPVALFCSRSQGRIDDAVNQRLSILAGLALGSSVSGRGQGQPRG